jgi:hypothetical protein
MSRRNYFARQDFRSVCPERHTVAIQKIGDNPEFAMAVDLAVDEKAMGWVL